MNFVTKEPPLASELKPTCGTLLFVASRESDSEVGIVTHHLDA